MPKYLTYLQPGDVVIVDSREHIVEMVNDCRARCRPLEKKTKSFTPETGVNAGKELTISASQQTVNISANSEVPIVRRAPELLRKPQATQQNSNQ